MLDTVWIVLGCALAMTTVVGTIELLVVTVGGLLPLRRVRARKQKRLRIAVVIPAHNEESGIAGCIRSVSGCDRLTADHSIIVVADNCTDATAEAAREAGARVLIRDDAARRGKGYALDFAFRTLLTETFDAMIVIDADSVVEPGLITEFARLFSGGADAVQCRYVVNNPSASIRTRLMNLALMAFNVLRPRGRDRWGLSVGLLGNGFGLTRETLDAVPYDAASVVEDLEYHLRLVSAGHRVRFADGTAVRGDMPAGGSGVSTQRARWEGGRFRLIASEAPRLAVRVLGGELTLVEPLMELLLLPLAFHVCLLLATLVPPFAPTRIYAGAGLAVVGFHILAAVRAGGGGIKDLIALGSAPFYVAWKLAMIPRLVLSSRRNAAWVRTERAGTRGGKS